MEKTMKFCAGAVIAAGLAAMPVAVTAGSAILAVHIDGIEKNGRFPDMAAFCPKQGSKKTDVSPGVSWSGGPAGTRSYAVLMTDPDVPKDFSLINKPGITIPADAPRISVFHWVLVDIPPAITSLAPGAESEAVVPGGKPIGDTSHGRRGANVYTTFLAHTDGMAGTYGGYDGPCPPVNDERVHHYVICVIALDVRTLGLTGAFTGEDVEKAMAGHVLASGEAKADYTLNPHLAANAKPNS